ncbi:MAG: FAD-binding protein [Leptospirales bacterium]|nr:FAD-binding protein [Leptospirales bacterium]
MQRPDKDKIIRVKKSLSLALGEGRVIDGEDILKKYSTDKTPDTASMPDLLVAAETAEEAAVVLGICNEARFPVTPRGAGNGVTGGAIAVMGGLVLSLEKMNRILEIDTLNMVAVVEPGVVTEDIRRAALKEGLLYPPDPASLDSSSIGGNVSENAGGMSAVKYGVTKDYVLGIECLLPDGSKIITGGKTVKNVTGYNLTGIITGSEGTLAVITKLYLRLIPAPEAFVDALISFENMGAAIDGVYTILKNRIIPAALEFMEADAIRLVSRCLKEEMPFPEAGAHLLVRLDGSSKNALYDDLERISKALALDKDKIITAKSEEESEQLWIARRSIRKAIEETSPVFLAEDCSVPRSKIPDFLKSLKKELTEDGLNSVMFGHAGDGNVHIDILKGDIPYDEWKTMLPGLKRKIYKQAIDLGGTVSGEHGIGCLRKNYIPMAMSQDEIELHRRLKLAFDPNGILNPAKILPDEYLQGE